MKLKSLLMVLWAVCCIGVFLSGHSAKAKLFKNSYISFELPDRWSCTSEGTEWICRSDLAATTKEAIIILTAKEVGPSDTMDLYQKHLKTPKMIPGPKGQPVRSEIKDVHIAKIAGHDWVDGMHVSSEIANYYTRYLATVHERIAILVTFSAHKRSYTKFSGDFIRSIQSLRVVASPDLFQAKSNSQGVSGNEIIGGMGGQGMGAGMGPDEGDLPPEESGAGGSEKREKIFLFAVIIAAVGIYLFIKQSKS